MTRAATLAVCMAAFAAALCSSAADSTPVMVSLVAPAQAPSWNWDVAGVRLSLVYGDCRDFTGFDVGVVPRTSGEFTGLGVGGVNIVNGKLRGIELGLLNWSGYGGVAPGDRSVGVQYGIANYADSFVGLQDGFLSISTGRLSGVQYGYVNCVNDLVGVQCGSLIVLGVNVAYGSVDGCQIGILNYAQSMKWGAQIGLLNIICDNGLFPVLPILNGAF